MAARTTLSLYSRSFKGPSPLIADSEVMQRHVHLLQESYKHYTGKQLGGEEMATWEALHNSEAFVLASVGIQDDPIFNYGNRAAMNVFKLDWDEFTQFPGRYSADEENRESREKLLKMANQAEYLPDVEAIRVDAEKRRFKLVDAELFTVLSGDKQTRIGQAVWFPVSTLVYL
mmetsp:Transcript_14710/g.23932  ORF Transcript_14710/g.23932 Transcript_14710/m.23932 type:complete len:173 (-) Transcript_14710:2202-2720(-)|eukprot:CAMPEP_0203743926 /NCGR_PEP_ID=MMETSP0098-20131031/171_1 /ASSEMBLY_ACC=CAM_ASM_000208 /TAXON_ID=96639 /ORGANISM=" , Strain NY0313808BC1" /LENGTH=172 /DNA_ID=CAMNT_0050631305 /DNA_START=242 /DNA_END=760 /DNA_ORIENTATION=+